MSPSPDPLTNPYAPPAAVEAPDASTVRGTRSDDYEAERRSVVLMVLLSIVTAGIYPIVWYIRRTPFLDARQADKKVGVLPWLAVLLLGTVIVASAAGAPPGFLNAVQLVAGITNLVLAFRVAGILRSDFARSGRYVGVSSLAVFFFGCLYLQHVLNKAADTPVHARPKRKKATKPKPAAERVEAPEKDAEVAPETV